jgi:hypothetical protein
MRLKEYLIELEKITKQDLNNLERWADALFKSLNIDVEFTKHFLDRVNDKRNREQITFRELTQMFRDTYKKHGRKIPEFGPKAQAVVKDMVSDINMPFVLVWDRKNQELDLVAKTIMRKKNFKTSNRVLKVGDNRLK